MAMRVIRSSADWLREWPNHISPSLSRGPIFYLALKWRRRYRLCHRSWTSLTARYASSSNGDAPPSVTSGLLYPPIAPKSPSSQPPHAVGPTAAGNSLPPPHLPSSLSTEFPSEPSLIIILYPTAVPKSRAASISSSPKLLPSPPSIHELGESMLSSSSSHGTFEFCLAYLIRLID